MTYELDLLDEPLAAAKVSISSPLGKMQIAIAEVALGRAKMLEAMDAGQLTSFVKEISVALKAAIQADEAETLNILPELEARMQDRERLSAEFDAVPEARRLQ